MLNRLALFLVLCVAVHAGAAPELVPVKITKALFATGFDDNDIVQVVVTGHLPNTCYKLGPTGFTVESTAGTISLRQTAFRFSGVACLEVLIPYTQVVNIGIVSAGAYRLRDHSDGQSLGTLSVERAKTAGPDEFLYAPVTDAVIQSQSSPKAHTLVLSGTFSDRCTTVKEVRVSYYPEAIVVQPIADRHEPEGRGCPASPTRFSQSVALEPSPSGGFLLHVRSMNGQALNKLVDLP